jgi:hypothetical protein
MAETETNSLVVELTFENLAYVKIKKLKARLRSLLTFGKKILES